jgi:DNA-binding transcriptional MerR regulator
VDEGFSGKKTAEIVGITYRQLDYWARTNLVRPALADANGSGTRRRYSYHNLLELKIIKQLLDAGIKLEQVREVFTFLRERVGEEVASANIVINGHSVMLARDDGELIDLLKKGQGVLNVLPLGTVVDEVAASIESIERSHPPHAAGSPAAAGSLTLP